MMFGSLSPTTSGKHPVWQFGGK
ncbi:hypothetical protein Gotri_023859 [Gossypium trilobum]|uniref:Uncharacterized protein n=1 Tax=Gossypium trilobum TaxID=34281 RepID=A0A7J9DKI1_9ROSI|nr:hypothetical protein [Gossypium trilobum]